MIKFDEKYNYSTFSTFLREFLPEDYTEKEKDLADLERCKIINQAKELGYSESLDVYVLEMSHSKETDPRISIATDAFKLLATYGMDRALVIFKNDESKNYRFSYLTISLDLNEKNKIIRKYSNARRYSFYLGVDAKIKTPQQQLLSKGRVKDTDDLLNRFSVEVVNKEFYLEVAKHFDELVSEDFQSLTLPFKTDLNVRKNFAVRLIGRLMFCWFLRQKKSVQGQLIPDEILSSKAVKDNYYHETLERLFFEVLNTNIDDRDIRNEFFDQVPYLNGGLFSPQTEDYYELDRGTFTSKHINTLKINDEWFKKFFELLELYNFTIDENTVFDQELSVDPEMLGRIFENLLAEMNPETGSSERKRTGSFYTPRQIVEYMVDQSLLEYLKTKTSITKDKLNALISYDLNDDKEHPLTDNDKQKIVDALDTLKILDPACGSGAFPIGVLQKVVYILQVADKDGILWRNKRLKNVPELYRQKIEEEFDSKTLDYIRKLEIIENSIFGVDIQPIAVEVSRLRCFLTLVVEDEIDDTRKNRGIKALPNLDFKFVSANTLIGLPKSESNGLFEDHSGIEELSEIMSEYFSCSNQRKSEIRLRFTNTQKEILNKSFSSFGKSTGDLTLKLSLWDPFSNKSNPWFDPEWMFGIEEKFDIVIGNPPYVGQKMNNDIFRLIKLSTLGTFHQRRMDLFYFFFHFGLDILRENGILSFITTNYYITATGANKLRKDLYSRTTIIEMINFNELKIFEGALGQHNLITILQKGHRDKLAKTSITNNRGYLGSQILTDILSGIDLQTNYYTIPQDKLFNNGMIKLTTGNIDNVMDKIIKKNSRLNIICDVSTGIQTGAHKLSATHINKYGNLGDKGDGVFVLSKKELLKENISKDDPNVKPWFKNSDIKKYYTNLENDEYLLYILSHETSNEIKKHFEKYKPLLINRNIESGVTVNISDYDNFVINEKKLKYVMQHNSFKQGFYYNISYPRRQCIFEGEKIVSSQWAKSNIFGWNDTPWYGGTDLCIITKKQSEKKYSLKSILGILNSKIVYNWLYLYGKRKGELLELTVTPLSNIPIPLLDTPKKKATSHKINLLVDQIIKLKEKHKQSDTSELESQIDELVMDLYELTNEEKEILRSA